MSSLEWIRPSSSIFLLLMFLAGCMNPDRARVDRLARSGDRAASSGAATSAASSGSRTASGGIVAPASGGEWGATANVTSSAAPVSSRAQSPDVVPASVNGSKTDVGPIAQVSGRDQKQPGNSQSATLAPGGNSPTSSPSTPTLVAAPDSSVKLRELYNQAALRFATIDSYVARLRRREQVKGKDQPEELILFKFRKRPWSVYFKWLVPTGNGREVIYVKGQHGDMIHTLLAAGDMPLAPAGKHMALPPDNIFVRSASRHAITEAGIGVMIEKFGQALDSQERGEKKLGLITYLGTTKRPEYDAPLESVEHIVPSGLEPQLPHGGRRWVFFDPASHLPVLMITHDDRGHEVEYYCYDRLQYPVKLDDLDFDPDRLWPAKK
jgi:hypothetical protein